MFRKSYESSNQSQVAAMPDWNETPVSPDLTGLKVLVCDDERDARAAIALALQMCGAVVETAHSADEGIRLAGQTAFDAVVSDLAMPNGDGFSLLRGLRLRQKKMPVIALSAMRGEQIEKEVRDAGFSLHVDKPIEMSFLASAVADVVWSSRQRSEVKSGKSASHYGQN